MRFLLVSLLGLSVVSAIILGGGGGRGGFSGSYSSSSSGSSEEHHHHRPPHRPRPHRPHRPHRPPRPPPVRDPVCADGWTTFSRPQGNWCVKVFNRYVDQQTAENLCQNEGATLTGVQNAAERFQVADMGRALSQQHNLGLAEIWIGARRRSYCPTKPSCSAVDTFEWTDGHTTGTDGFFYPGPEPNAFVFRRPDYRAAWGVQTALMIHTHPTSNTAPAQFGYHHGDMDDQHWQASEEMYACGKRPT